MKKLSSLLLISVFYLLSTDTFAVSVAGITFDDNAIANQVTGSNGTFVNWNPAFDITGISSAQLATDMTDTSAASYVFSHDSNAYIDLAFTNTSVYNGAGNDLAIFFVGTGSHTGNLTLLDDNLGSIAFSDLTFTGYNVPELFYDASGKQIISPIYVSYLDLSVLGIEEGVALNNFRLEIANASAAPSLLAALNTTAPAAVPLPPTLLLFISGLLGLAIKTRR